jgi:hypothetical protein
MRRRQNPVTLSQRAAAHPSIDDNHHKPAKETDRGLRLAADGAEFGNLLVDYAAFRKFSRITCRA